MAPRQAARRTRELFETYTRDLAAEDLHRLFTRETRDAYRFFSRGADEEELARRPWHERVAFRARRLFVGFTLKLSPARRMLYLLALVAAALGLIRLFQGVGVVSFPFGLPFVSVPVIAPRFLDGTLAMLAAFVLINLLVLLEVADRLSLKNELEVAREIQLAMLPAGTFRSADIEACGVTRPANTVGGDFYDILPLPDGRIGIALGDVAGKGSPAALLMALLLAMLRTLVDEGLEPAALVERLNVQIARHSPPSRFITLFYAVYDPRTGGIVYVNAGQTPPLVYRRVGTFERLASTGVALGMFEASRYAAESTRLAPGESLILYSDGITEAEDPQGRPFEEAGLERVVAVDPRRDPATLGTVVLRAVAAHAQDTRFADDLTVLVLQRQGS
jgi:serine phosphatase RsbU (regulator of sigma subunit)